MHIFFTSATHDVVNLNNEDVGNQEQFLLAFDLKQCIWYKRLAKDLKTLHSLTSLKYIFMQSQEMTVRMLPIYKYVSYLGVNSVWANRYLHHNGIT